jgi:hypothetical protein
MADLVDPDELKQQASDRFTKRVALSVAVYAVVLAITALGGSNAMKDAMLHQMKASNLWAYYQAKSGREYSTKLTLDRFDFDRSYLPKEVGDRADETVNRLKQEAERYGREKDEIKAQAEAREADRDLAMQRDPYFDYAEVLLQIAIVMASVAILSRSRPTWWISLVLAGLGSFLCVNGHTLLVKVPGF